MKRILEILSLEENEIELYINSRLNELNNDESNMEISLEEDGKIYKNWINTNAVYLPSGNKSKGFKIDKEFIREFILDIRDKFKNIPQEKLKNTLTEEILIKWFNMYVINYFGGNYNEDKRKQIYGYGSLNSIGQTLNISTLKGLNIARCIEKSAALNQILSFLDIDSSLVLSNANDIGHAYCLVNRNNQYYIVNPNFYGKDENNKGIPYIFPINPNSNNIYFDPSLYGDDSSMKINYNFPNQLLLEKTKTY